MTHPRENLNYQAATSMRLGKYSEALLTLKHSLDTFGIHITSLCDLASCYYMLGDYLSFRKYTLLALHEYEENFRQFSEKTISESSLALGKLLEEIGFIYLAIKIYKTAANQDLIKFKTSAQRLRSQELRCLCTLNLKHEISLAYIACENMQIDSPETYTENLHALMLADCKLFGLNTAQVRLLKGLTTANISYKRLLLFDYLYEFLCEPDNQNFNENLFTGIIYQECDAFEKSLWDIFLNFKNESLHEPLTLQRSEGMSPMSAAKYLYLLTIYQQPGIDNNSTITKLQLFMRNFDSSTRTDLQQLWITDLSVKTLTITEQTIHLETGKIISAQRQQNLLQILRLFNQQQILETEKAIRTLFDDEYTESSFNRLRQAIARGNRFLATELGFNEPLNLSKSHLKLSERFRIETASGDTEMFPSRR